MDYTADGAANLNERLAQYSCAWLLRRDNNSKRNETNVTVVVYHRRSIESPSDEIALHSDSSLGVGSTSTTTPGRGVVPIQAANGVFPNSITLVYKVDQRPPIRRGGWILDATMDPGQSVSSTGQFIPGQMQGFYYRVTDFTETETSPGFGIFQNVLQLETRLRPRQVELTTGATPRLIIVQDRVLEVFDTGPLEMNSSCRIN